MLLQDKLGEIIIYGAPPIVPTAEGYIKSTNNTTSPIINLRQISCMINGRTFPSEPYNFNFTIKGSTLNIEDDGQNDLTGAYGEYISCYRQQEGTKMLNFEQWIVTPIFCFKLEGSLLYIEHHQ